MKEDGKIHVEVGGKRQRKTLHIECDPATMTEIACLVFTKLQNTEAKPVPPEDVAEISIIRQSPADTAHEKSQDRKTIASCLAGALVLIGMFVLMMIGAGTVIDWLKGS